MGSKVKSDTDDDSLERAPWEDGALAVDVTSEPADVVLKNCLSDDLPLRLMYIKGLAAAATRASKRDLLTLLEALSTLLDDEALGVRLEALHQLQQLAKMAGCTAAPEDVEEAVLDALEQQFKPSLDPGGPGGGVRQGGTGTGALPMVREALLASLDSVCCTLGPRQSYPLLMRLLRAANAALDKPGGVGPASGIGAGAGGPVAGGGGGKAGGDASLTALSLAVLAVRHLDPDRGGLAMAAMACRLSRHVDIRVREALAGALPLLYGTYAAYPGALEQLFVVYDTLCGDKVWSVRQACARAVPELSLLCSRCDSGSCGDGGGKGEESAEGRPPLPPLQQQQQQQETQADAFQLRLLRNLFLDTLLPTKSQWVVTAVRQQAGPVIATLRPTPAAAALLPPLLDVYCAAAAAVGQGAIDVRRLCAKSFADVVSKAGPARWPQLRPVLTRLLAATDTATLSSLVASAERVVRLLASSGSSVADAIGDGDCARLDLYGAAEQVVSGPLLDVLRNQLHLVVPAASGAMAGLLAVCPPGMQRELLQVFPQLCVAPARGCDAAGRRCGDWRSRQLLARHLKSSLEAVMAAATGPDAEAVVVRCALTLCGDPVWAVRQVAAAQVGGMLVALTVAPPEAPRAASWDAVASSETGAGADGDHGSHSGGAATASNWRAGDCGGGDFGDSVGQGAGSEDGGILGGRKVKPDGQVAGVAGHEEDHGPNPPGAGSGFEREVTGSSLRDGEGNPGSGSRSRSGTGSGQQPRSPPPEAVEAATESAPSSSSPPTQRSEDCLRAESCQPEAPAVVPAAGTGAGSALSPERVSPTPGEATNNGVTDINGNGMAGTNGSGGGGQGGLQCGRLTASQRSWLERLAQRAVLQSAVVNAKAEGSGNDGGDGDGDGPGTAALFGLLGGWLESALDSGLRADEELLTACWAGANGGDKVLALNDD